MKSKKLHVYEALLLLGLDEEKGSWEVTNLDAALPAGVMADLLLEGSVEIDAAGELRPVAGATTDDPILSSCLANLRSVGKTSVGDWIRGLANSNLVASVADVLCDRGVLRPEKSRFLFFHTHTFYPELDGEPERNLREHLRRVIFEEDGPVQPYMSLLISIADATGLLGAVFDRREVLTHRDRIEHIQSGDSLGDHVLHTAVEMGARRAAEQLARWKSQVYGAAASMGR